MTSSTNTSNKRVKVTAPSRRTTQPVQSLPAKVEPIESQDALTVSSWAVSPELLQAQHCIHQLFEDQVLKTPDAIALQASSQTLTYAQLNQKANQLAHYLIELGITPDSLVPVSTPRSLEMVIAILGVLKAGAAYVPIDPAYPAVRRAYLLKDVLQNSPTSLLLTHSLLAATLTADLSFSESAINPANFNPANFNPANFNPANKSAFNKSVAPEPTSSAQLDSNNLSPTCLLLDTDWSTVAKYPQHNPDVCINASNLAYVIYTSGSTGNPKGVMVKHQGVVNHARAMAAAFEMSPADRMLQFSSMSFDIITEELYPTLITGATLVLRPEEIATSLSAFLAFTATEKITILDLPTAFWHELVNGLTRFADQPNCSQRDRLSKAVRLVIVGGEKASLAAYRQWFNLVGEYPRWLNTYGPTEATVTTTLYDPLAEGFDATKELPIGRAIANTQTYVLDEALEPVTPGEAGELYIGGAGLARGYLNLPEKTAAAFITSPFSSNQRLYKTGDRVRELPDGNLEFVGRVDFQVKIHGFRIELGEIESCLERHPHVRQQIVLAREDVPGQKRLVAYVVMEEAEAHRADEQSLHRPSLDRPALNRPSLDRPCSCHELNIHDLQAYLRQTLPSYMIPSAFVALSALPMTTNGKVDRRALPIPVNQQKAEVAAPRSPLESELVKIWESVLNVQPIGITDNFFDMGGHSLLAMRLFNEIEATFQRSLPVTTIFAEPTIQQLAPILAAEMAFDRQQGQQQQTSQQIAAIESVVLLKAGKRDRTPLFLVHDADGITSPYINLAAKLPGDRSVYGIEPLSEPSVPMVHSRIPDMAAYYIQQMRCVRPNGPYLIGGLCAGGVIAFEMALQLEALGEVVDLTVLLEAPDVAATERSSLAARRLESLKESLPAGKAQKIKHFTTKAANVIRYEVQNRFKQATTTVRIKAFRYWQDRQAKGWTPPESLQGLEARSLYLFAEKSYEPSARLHGKVVLVKAAGPGQDSADRPYHEVYQDALFGWRDRTHQPIEHHQVPGGHFTMLNAQNVLAVIEAIAPLMPSS